MRRVRCYECGKRYDYDEDGFCPYCGCFNQPVKAADIDAGGQVVRLDGLNERDHAGSFVHRELHAENRARQGSELEAEPPRRVKRVPTPTATLLIGAAVFIWFVFVAILGSFLYGNTAQ